MKEAIDRAIEAVPRGIALVDGVLIVKSYYIPYIYGRQAYVVEGTPLINPSLASNYKFSFETGYAVIHCNGRGEVVTARSVNTTVSENHYGI